MSKILVIDDDKAFLQSIIDVLALRYEVTGTTSAKDGIKLCNRANYDLIIVDLYMDEMTGTTFAEIVHDMYSNQKIVILSGNASISDQLDVLDGCAVDFIGKDTPPEVLTKRIEKILENHNSNIELTSLKEKIVLNKSSRFVYKEDQKFHVSQKEFSLLELFLENKNEVISREDIYHSVWGEELHTTNIRIVDIYILKLRNKLNISSIYSERGVGYIWEE
ncbi:MAG: response regulator transcription factor [Bacilli bacterium]